MTLSMTFISFFFYLTSLPEQLTSVFILLVERVNFTLEASIGGKLVHHADAL